GSWVSSPRTWRRRAAAPATTATATGTATATAGTTAARAATRGAVGRRRGRPTPRWWRARPAAGSRAGWGPSRPPGAGRSVEGGGAPGLAARTPRARRAAPAAHRLRPRRRRAGAGPRGRGDARARERGQGGAARVRRRRVPARRPAAPRPAPLRGGPGAQRRHEEDGHPHPRGLRRQHGGREGRTLRLRLVPAGGERGLGLRGRRRRPRRLAREPVALPQRHGRPLLRAGRGPRRDLLDAGVRRAALTAAAAPPAAPCRADGTHGAAAGPPLYLAATNSSRSPGLSWARRGRSAGCTTAGLA